MKMSRIRLRSEFLPPLVHFELARAGRKKWTYALRAAPLILAISWLATSMPLPLSQNECFEIFNGNISLVAFWLAGPIAAAGAIAGQRESGTADLLTLASVDGRNMYGGSLIVVMLQVWSVMISVMPLAVLAGETAATLAVYAVASAGTAFAIASLGLLCSAYSQSAVEALIRCYGVLIGLVAVQEGLAAATVIWTMDWLRLRSDMESMRLSAFGVQITVGLFCSYFAVRRVQRVDDVVQTAPRRKPMDLRSEKKALRSFMWRTSHAPLPLWDRFTNFTKVVVVTAVTGAMLIMPQAIFLIVPLCLLLMVSEVDQVRSAERLDEIRLTSLSLESLGHSFGAVHMWRWLPLAAIFIGARAGFTWDLGYGAPAPWYAYVVAALNGAGAWWLMAWLGLYNAYGTGPAVYRVFLALIMYVIYEFFFVTCLASALTMPIYELSGATYTGPGLAPAEKAVAPIVLVAFGLRIRGLWMKRFLGVKKTFLPTAKNNAN